MASFFKFRTGFRFILVLTVVAVTALAVITTTSQFSSYVSTEIIHIAKHEVESNNQIVASSLSKIISDKLMSVEGHLEVLANTPAAQNGEYDRMVTLLTLKQHATNDLTESYFWLDKDGRVVWGTLVNEKPEMSRFIGADFSNTEYFKNARDSLRPASTTVKDSPDGLLRIHISYPIINAKSGNFDGIVAATIRPEGLASFVKSQIPSQFTGRIGLIDKGGIIIYSSDDSSLIGGSVFSNRVQDVYSTIFDTRAERDRYDNLLRDSLKGQEGSVQDIVIASAAYAYSYAPVHAGRGDDGLLGTLHVVSSYALSSSATLLLDQQNNVSILSMVFIGAVAAGIAVVVLTWNKRLNRLVSERTLKLKAQAEQLLKLNEELSSKTLELQKANENLQVNDMLQRDFIDIAAHEFRTPIQPLLGIADIYEHQLKTAYDSSSSQKDKRMEITQAEMEMIIRNARRLERLTSDMLQITHIEGRSFRLNKERVNLGKLIREAELNAEQLVMADKKKIDIKTNYALPELHDVFLELDRMRIGQVLHNLLANSIKFTTEGEISINVRRTESNEITVSVKDAGTGIDLDIMPRLFTKFASKPYSESAGIGFGLYISKKIIEAHGGMIWAENNKDGKGATFSFTLALAQEIARTTE